ncbi:MAG: hypothetical protein WC641_01240 [Patescibacteria group bacterium]
MNKSISVIFLSALVFVGAGCGSKNTSPQPTKQPAAQNVTTINDSGVIVDSESMGELVKLGKGMKCVLNKPSEYIISMITYTSRGKMRNELTAKGPSGVPMIEHQIIDGTWIYSWEDSNKGQATKTNMEDLQKLSGTTSTVTQPKDASNDMKYTCSNWSGDDSFFALPAGVNFRDFKEVMCEPCEKISDAKFKAQCKKSIGC